MATSANQPAPGLDELPAPGVGARDAPPVADALAALLEVVVEGGGLPEVAAGLVGLLGGAVVITTPDGRVLADAGDVHDLDQAYDAACFLPSGRLHTEQEPVGLSAHPGRPGNHVVVRIAAGRVDHGRIVAFSATGSLTPADVPTVERAATVAALAVTKQLAVRAVESKYQADFLRDLLTGQVVPEVGVSHAASLGWDVDRPVVVAFSRGSSYALGYALEHPTGLRGLVIGDYFARHVGLPEAFVEQQLRSKVRGVPIAERMPEHAVRRVFAESREVPLWGRLAEIRCPVLVIRGGRKGALVGDELAAQWQAALPSVELAMLADAGHDLWSRDVDAYLAVLLPFLDRVGPTAVRGPSS